MSLTFDTECDSLATDGNDLVQKLSFEPSFHSERRVKKPKAGRIVPSRYKAAAASYKKDDKPAVIRSRKDIEKTKCSAPVSLESTIAHLECIHSERKVQIPHERTFEGSKKKMIKDSKVPVSRDKEVHVSRKAYDEKPAIARGRKIMLDISRRDYLRHRLLQAAYLDIMSSIAFDKQEKAAQKQLYCLWRAVEDGKKEVFELDKAIATERQKIALDSCLDIQVNGLASLVSSVSKATDPHRVTSAALDATRHNVFLHNVSSPSNEEEMKDLLKSSKDILADTVPYITQGVPVVMELSSVHQELVSTTEEEIMEFERSWKKLSETIKLQLQESSLFYENLQTADLII